jgi:hypothetical protein
MKWDTQKAQAIKNDYDTYLKTFSHYHVAGTTVGKHIDECAKCGLDLRDLIHKRD